MSWVLGVFGCCWVIGLLYWLDLGVGRTCALRDGCFLGFLMFRFSIGWIWKWWRTCVLRDGGFLMFRFSIG